MDLSSPPVSSRREPELIDDSDSDDELCGGNVPCSQSPYFTQPTQPLPRTSLHQTQATQIVSRTTLKPSLPPVLSSPRSVVEVPASSPFQPKTTSVQPGRLGSAMAPPGTFFRAPLRAPATGQKRTCIELSDDEDSRRPHFISDDSSDNEGPTRGDIQPSVFRRCESTIPTNSTKPSGAETMPNKTTPAARKLTEARLQQLASKVYKQTHGRRSPNTCKEALLQNGLDVQKTVRYISDLPSRSPSPESEVIEVEEIPRGWTSPSPEPSKPAQKSITVTPSTPQPPRRGRLVQGRRNRGPVAESSPFSVDPLSLPTTQIVDLVSDDDDDDDKFNQDDASPQPLELQNPAQMAFEERMLSYLNNCNAIQLMAIANIRADNAEVMLKHQPFATLDDARNVVVTKKSARKKVAKVALGDDVVDSIESYARALDGIDRIVGVCEQQGVAVAAATSRWNLDFTGSDKNTKAAIEDDRPPTPASMGSPAKQLKALPISKEPRLMRGHCTMKPYQLYGLNWMYLLYERSFGGILADDMGLGKTCQVISLMCAVVEQFEDSGVDEDNRPWPNLIVVPPSTLSNWEAEFKKFAPDMNVISYSGGQQDRDEVADEVLENPADYHVILTTYSQLGRAEDIDNLKRIRPMIAVFDEGHKLKNPKTKLYKDLIRLTASWRLLLTGTPVQNNLMEMVALLRFIEPDLFRDHFADLEALFNQKVSLQDVSNGALLYSERVTRARSILEPFILQRRKEQVLMSLPPKTSRMVYCELDKTQKKIYDGYERYFRRGKDLRPAAPEPKGTDPDLNNIWMQLRKSAIHPQLFRRWFTDEKVAEMANILMRKIDQSILQQDNLGHLVAELKNCSDFELHLWCRDYPCIRKFDIPELSFMKSGKIQELLKLIREYEQNGDKVLVFTRFAKVIEILRECLATEDIEYVALQGNTNVGDRQELIDQFQGDPSITAFLLTTGAGGTGINLTAANKVIVFDQSDNPQDDLQAENRAHRLGQTRPVEIIKLISKDTIEELVHAACEKKIELANRVTGWRGGHVTITAGEMEETIRKELMARDNITPPSSD